jgi:hypothetical protein
LDDDYEDPPMDFEDLDDGLGDGVDGASVFHPSSTAASVSGKSLKTAPRSSEISLPSGLSIDTIARLTHDELRHNAEFMKYVRMVDSLHELLNFRSSGSTCESLSPPLSFDAVLYFFQRSPCLLRLFTLVTRPHNHSHSLSS